MLLKRLPGDLFIVFRADGKNYSSLLQLERPFLKLSECLPNSQFMTNLDVLQTIITNDSSPSGVVQIKNQTLLKLTLNRHYDIHNAISHVGQYINGEHHLCCNIYRWIKHHISSVLVLQRGNVTHKKIALFVRQVHQLIVQLPDLIRK